jgi:predicted metal-dependent phosphotriesterase family hydrolase
MRQFIRVLQALGIGDAEIDTMARKNPARILGIV